MSDKESDKHLVMDKQVSSYIDEVGLYSDEHVGYIEKLNRLLEEMKNSGNSAERKNYVAFQETVRSFEHYLADKKIVLTPHEKERLSVITSSGLNNLAKKRLVEDLIHSVRERHTSEIDSRIEEEKRKKEVAELKKSRSLIMNWYNLLMFSLEYGTITLFTHRLRSEYYDLLRVKALSWFGSVRDDIKKVLDQYYFYLSVLEYNSLVSLYEAGKALENMRGVPKNLSYSYGELQSVMTDFTSLYIAVSVNIKYVDSGLKKIFKDEPPAHGFWGFIGLLTDRPLVNGRVVRHCEEEAVKQTIRGVLFSYYTIYAGVRVRTMNQLMYLAGDDGLINSREKELTGEARMDLEKRETQEKSDGFRITTRLNELVNVIEKYKEEGVALSARIFALEAKGNISSWNREAESKPFFRLMKILEGMKKYILELISDGSPLLLEYDGNEYKNYFENQPELLKAITDYLEFAIELQGSREKDISGFRLEDEENTADFIRRIMAQGTDLPKVTGARNLREMLSGISVKCYNLCMRFNDLINRYALAGKKESPDLTQNYDFFLNAKLLHPKLRGFELIVNKRDTTLSDLVEAGCATCQYIAEYLDHPGIKALYDEVVKLREDNSRFTSAQDKAEMPLDRQGGGNTSESDMDNLYTDRMTGIKNWSYFEDFVLPEYYDEHLNYKGGNRRHVFCAEISNLSEINRRSGNDTGDIVYRSFTQLIAGQLKKGGSGNIAIRGGGGMVIGYISDIQAIDAVDILHKIYLKMNRMEYEQTVTVIPDPVINTGIYTEVKGSNVHTNIEIAKKIMMQASGGSTGHVSFLKNPDQIISEKDLDRRGYLKEGLISVIS